MSGVTKKLMSSSGGVAGFTAIEDVFSTYLYTGNGSTQTITNGIDLAGEGGLVWNKPRSGTYATDDHALSDTERGVNKILRSNTTSAEAAGSVQVYNSDGFTLGSATGNLTSTNYASWTFRKAPRFFDVVTYTGTGSAQTIDHNLGAVPACIIVKRTDSTGNWMVYHKGVSILGVNAETRRLLLNSSITASASTTYWNDTAPTDSVFTLGTSVDGNASGGTYVAYLFADDAGGFGESEEESVIKCGSYEGTGVSGNTVELGWEPQFVLIKRINVSGAAWILVDSMRGLPSLGGTTLKLSPNVADAESSFTDVGITATGFQLGGAASVNSSSSDYIYIAIRRGPMRAPESGTEVFAPVAYTGDAVDNRVITTGFPVDYLFATTRALLNNDGNVFDRMRGAKQRLVTQSTAAESTMSANYYVDGLDSNTGFILGGSGGLNSNGTTFISHAFRRAPEFFDVVAYTGDGVAGRTVSHNLGVAPEMMIVKCRDSAGRNWCVYNSDLSGTQYLYLSSTQAAETTSVFWNNADPTSEVFTLGANSVVNGSGDTYIAYLFATLAGVSKVGSYTGNGTSQTINCGFTTGARFILIKRTDSTGDWYVWDTARGIVAANDPHLSLNTTAAEVTTDDSIDPDSSGFIVNQVAATNINVSAASYIFYAVA